MSNVIMKTAVATLSSIPVIKESANFKYIKGEFTDQSAVATARYSL